MVWMTSLRLDRTEVDAEGSPTKVPLWWEWWRSLASCRTTLLVTFTFAMFSIAVTHDVGGGP